MSQLPVAPCIFFQLPSLITFTSEPQICSNTFTNSKQKWSLLQALKPVPPWVFHSHFQNDILTIQCLKKIETQITSMFLMNLRFNITFSRKTKKFSWPKIYTMYPFVGLWYNIWVKNSPERKLHLKYLEHEESEGE